MSPPKLTPRRRRAGRAADDAALLERLRALPDGERARVLEAMTQKQLREWRTRFPLWGHAGQLAPPGDWGVWLIRAGRGFGKTRAGAEWVIETARVLGKGGRIALVGASFDDARRVMVEGPSGVLALARREAPARYRKGSATVTFAGGATAHIYSAGAPEALRGPEHHAAWCDELAKWRYGDAAWDNLRLGLRLDAEGWDQARCVVTTTPRSTPLMQRVMAMRDMVETHGTTADNPHLPPTFLTAMTEQYGGTRLGRQELGGELIDDSVGALWPRSLLEGCRIEAAPALVRVVVGVDPPAGTDGDACGIVACGIDAAGDGVVLEDASVAGLRPEGWAHSVAACAARHRADRVIAEKNNGGEMVRSVLRAADVALPIRLVHASRGKVARAEPVAALYEGGRVKHAGAFGALEDELAGLMPGGGYVGPGRSPDRADACVWALTELMLGKRGAAAVKHF